MKKLLFILLVLCIVSCKDENTMPPTDPTDPLKDTKEYVQKMMTNIYYWADETPKIDVADYGDITDLFTAYKVKKDRWSLIYDGKSFKDKMEGTSLSHGMVVRLPAEYFNDYSPKVATVVHNSPMSENGVKRGWTLTHIGGTPVMTLFSNGTFDYECYGKTSNTFTFLDSESKEVTVSVSKREIKSRSVYMDTVFTDTDFAGLPHKVGYMQYSIFSPDMLAEITTTIAKLKAEGIKDLILDLRYNGGGDSRATSLLANLLAPPSADGKVLQNYNYNAKNASKNTSLLIKREAGALDLSRIYIIATKKSASASEVIINGLRPLMEVIQVGTTTFGKPCGMIDYPYPNKENPEYVFLPICYFSTNSVGFGDYENGLIPTYNREDDLYHDFGVEEDLIKTCLTHIATGTVPPLPPVVNNTKARSAGVRLETEVDKPGYGLDILFVE